MNALALLTDEFLAEHFDPGSLLRAQAYVDHAVEGLEIGQLSAGSVTATADVFGSRPEPYQVQLHAEVGPRSGRGWVFSVCTCPVRSMCKHGAAVALRLRQGFVDTQRRPAWQHRLGRLVDAVAEHDRLTSDPVPVAIEVSLDPGRQRMYGAASPRAVRLRPMRPGSRQPWVKSGIDWGDFSGAYARLRHPAAQADALGALQSMLVVHRTYSVAGVPPSLDEFGRRVVDLLRDAVAAGVELLVGPHLTAVRLADDPVDVVADLTGDETGARLEVVATDGERRWSGGEVLLVGRPAEVVALVDEAGALTLASTVRPVPSGVVEILADGPLEVPPGDVDTFLSRLVPVRRVLPLRSPDGSVPVPEPVPPVLQVTVVWVSSTDAELTWEWTYGEARCPLDARDGLGGVRDRAAETPIRERVQPDLLGRRRITDGDALALAIHDLPHLRELDGVNVVEVQRPDFRASDAAPEIAFDLVEPEDAAVTDWLDLAVTVTVEGEGVPLPDVLAALTRGDEFLVLPSGLFVPTDDPAFARLREVVEAAAELRERDGDTVSVGKADLGVWAQLAELGVVDAQAAQWVARAQALRDLTDLPRPEPEGLATELRSYQREGFWWLSFLHDHGLGGVLADDMGLGKTLQVLALVQRAVRRGSTTPYLVVAPTSVVTAWQHEAARHAPGLRVGVVGRRGDDVAAIAAASDLVLTTYTVARLAQAEFSSLPWAGLILDEAQQVKNHQSKTYAAVRRIEAPFRLAVTGTPFENRLMELWALLSITAPGLYPTPRKFTDLVVKPVEKAGERDALDRFRRRIKPFVLRRTKELVADDLPPKQEQVLDVTLEPRHRKIYDTHLAKERQRILGLIDDDFDRNRVAILAALTKLRMLALDPALVDPEHERVGSAKLDLLADHLAEITAEGHRALVFSQFTSFLERVRTRLDGEGVTTSYLDGATRDRAGVIDEFRRGASSVFLISLKAGGVGLTLTEADYVFVLDPWWNPAAENQAVDRAHRIGQDKHVHVYRLVADDTIEEKVMELKARKAELFAKVIDGEGAMGTALDADDIRALFED